MQEDGASSGLAVALPSGRRIEIGRGFDAHTLRCCWVCWSGSEHVRLGAGDGSIGCGATDMRKGFEGLYGLARDRLLCDPLSGHVFLFANAQRNRLKLLFWDGSGCGSAPSVWRRGVPLAGVRERAGQGGTQPRGVGAAVRGHRSGPGPAPGDGTGTLKSRRNRYSHKLHSQSTCQLSHCMLCY